jgi:hypothetical protein
MRSALAFAGLLLSFSAAAQPFNKIYNTADNWDFAISLCANSDGGYTELGFSGFAPSSATVVKRLAPTGAVIWSHTFGKDIWRVVRQTADGGFVLFGDGTLSTDPKKVVPKIIRITADGQFLWGREFLITNPDGTPGNYAQGVAMVIDPADQGFVVGGTFYTQLATIYEPWLGKLDAKGNKIWLDAFHNIDPVGNSSIAAVSVPSGGGAIGVGTFGDLQGTVLQMFATEANAKGGLMFYDSYPITGQTGWARLADITPVPGTKTARVSGTLRNFTQLKLNNSVMVEGLLDEATLHLTFASVLWDATPKFTNVLMTNSSVVMDPNGKGFYLGGEVTWTEGGVFKNGFREAIWIHAVAPLFGMRYGDGDGPFETNLKDLDGTPAIPSLGGPGFVSAVEIRQPAMPYSGDDVVRANAGGSAGACESKTPISGAQIQTIELLKHPRIRTWNLQPYKVPVADRAVTVQPCSAIEGAAHKAPAPAQFAPGATPPELPALTPAQPYLKPCEGFCMPDER